jgi:hypothetical protein
MPAETPLMLYIVYHLATSAVEEIGKMANFLSKTHQRRCLLCHQRGPCEVASSTICIRHQTIISLRLLVLLARAGRFGKFWRALTWNL